MLTRAPDLCPHCGGSLASGAPEMARPAPHAPHRHDLEELARLAGIESAFDESVRARASQEDIRKLVAKRRRAAP